MMTAQLSFVIFCIYNYDEKRIKNKRFSQQRNITVIYRISVVLLSTGDDLLNQYLEGTFKFVTVI